MGASLSETANRRFFLNIQRERVEYWGTRRLNLLDDYYKAVTTGTRRLWMMCNLR